MSKINATTRRQSEATCRCNLLRGMAGLQKYQTQERERDDVLHVFLRGRWRVSEGVERMIDEMFSHTQPHCFHSLYSTDKRYGDTRLWSSAPAAISMMTSSLLTGTAGSGFMFPQLCNNSCLLLVPQHMHLPQLLAR